MNLSVSSSLWENMGSSGRQKALRGQGLSEVTPPWLDGDQLSAAWPGPPLQPGPSCPLRPLPIGGDPEGGCEQTLSYGHRPLRVRKCCWQLAGEAGEARQVLG